MRKLVYFSVFMLMVLGFFVTGDMLENSEDYEDESVSTPWTWNVDAEAWQTTNSEAYEGTYSMNCNNGGAGHCRGYYEDMTSAGLSQSKKVDVWVYITSTGNDFLY